MASASKQASTSPAGAQALELYSQMALIRAFEEESERQYKRARIGGYCHLSIGQEATCVGSVAAMANDDLLVTGYRSHGFALARGLSPESVMAELFGRSDGCASGRGGSMHLFSVAHGYYGGWGIVGGQLPIATGLGLAIVRQKRDAAVLCELGDGAANIGAFHESLNLASLWELPVVFLIANNAYAMGTSTERASAEPELFRRAAAYRIVGERIDGDDVEEVLEAAGRILDRARSERRPALLECLTYRFRGHSVADAGLAYRAKAEIEERQDADPIRRYRERLLASGIDESRLEIADDRARARVEMAVSYAEQSDPPPVTELAAGMHSPVSARQFERMLAGSAFGERELVFEAGLGRGRLADGARA